MIRTCSSRIRSHGSSGTAVVLVLIMAVALLGMLGLAIDTGVVLSSRAQLERSAQQAALGAMSRFLLELDKPLGNASQSAFYSSAKAAAQDQAQRILRLNPFLGNGFRLSESTWGLSQGSSQGDSAVGTIEFGKYYVEEPSTGDLCEGSYPCFVPRPSDAAPSAGSYTDPDSAIRIHVGTGDKPIRPIFGKLLRFGDTSFSTHATSTKVIQNLAFLIDLSPSVVSQGYRRFGTRNDTGEPPAPPLPKGTQCNSVPQWFRYDACRIDQTGANYALQHSLVSSADTPPYEPCTDASCLEMGTGSPPNYTDFNSPGDFYAMIWAEQCLTRASAPCTTTDHAQSDYQRVMVNFGDNVSLNRTRVEEDAANLPPYLCSGSFAHYIDAGYNCPSGISFCASPEPLLSILKTSGRALSIVENRAVPGDRVLVAGFDEYFFRSRITCETTTGTSPASNCRQDLGEKKLVRTIAADFSTFKTALTAFDGTTGAPTGNPPTFVTRGFFPRYLNTDGNFALWDTFQEMNSASTSRLARNLIFLFTDGLFNCRVPSDTRQIQSLTPVVGGNNDYFDLRTCGGSSASSVTDSIAQIWSIPGPNGKTLSENLIDSKVAVSVFMFGPGAHRVVRKSTAPSGGCMTLEEATFGAGADFDGYVDPTTAAATPESNPYLDLVSGLPNPAFYEQNRLFELAKATRGKWIPILNSIEDPANPGQGFNFAPQLEQACEDAATPGSVISNFSITLQSGASTINIPVTDSAGRLLYDPAGREAEDQISDALESVLEPGFVLAEG